MYEKDKHQRITLRLSDEQFSYVREKAEALGVTPSEFLRMVVNSALYSEKKLANKMEALGRENDKAHIDNQL